MWKTPLTSRVRNPHSGVLALCPQCDALGPHLAQGQGVACIDCGEWLGRLTPDVFIPAEAEREPATQGGLERVQAERILQQVMQHAQAAHGRQGRRYASLLGLGV